MGCPECKSSAERGKRFCDNCGNVLEIEDAIIRIIDEELVVSNERASLGNSKSKAISLLERVNWKSKKVVTIATAITAVILISVSLLLILNKDHREYGDIVLMTKLNEGKQDLYIGSPSKGEVKLASGIGDNPIRYPYIITGRNTKKVIYCSEEGELYEADEKGNAEEIAKNVTINRLSLAEDLTKYVFTTNDTNTFYLKEKGRAKVQIDTEVQGGAFLEDGKTILYLKGNKELFMRKLDGKISKVVEGLDTILHFGSKGGIVFVKDTNKLVYKCYDASEEKVLKEYMGGGLNEVLNDIASKGLMSKDYFVYMVDDKLYFIKMGEKEPVTIASGVGRYMNTQGLIVYEDTKGNWYGVKLGDTRKYGLPKMKTAVQMRYINEQVFYTDTNGSLYKAELDSDNAVKLQNNIIGLYSAKEEVYFLTSEGIDKTLYMVNSEGDILNVQSKVAKACSVGENYITYLTVDGDLYVDEKMVQSNVRRYGVTEKSVFSIDSDYSMYLIQDKSNPKKVIEKVSDYSSIYYGEKYLFNIEYLMNQQYEVLQ